MRKTTGDLLAARFWAKVRYTNECWFWTGGHGVYGVMKVQGKMRGAHRVAWEIVNGPVPDGLNVLHRCDTPLCVRPDHLFVGTQSDNLKDMVAKGRGKTAAQQAAILRETGDSHWSRRRPELVKRGEQRATAKLTEADVREIRRLSSEGQTLKQIAAQFGVGFTNISMIVRRDTWKHVD